MEDGLHLGGKNTKGPFAMLEPHDQEIGGLYLVRERGTTDDEFAKILKGPSGNWIICRSFQVQTIVTVPRSAAR